MRMKKHIHYSLQRSELRRLASYKVFMFYCVVRVCTVLYGRYGY